MKNLKNFKSWEKQGLRIFQKEDKRVYLVAEYNSCYGDIVTCFQIGDKAHRTGVKSRYSGRELSCHASNNLLGERKFNRSLTYECLYLPLGLNDKDALRIGKDGWNAVHSEYLTIASQLERKGWKRVS